MAKETKCSDHGFFLKNQNQPEKTQTIEICVETKIVTETTPVLFVQNTDSAHKQSVTKKNKEK